MSIRYSCIYYVFIVLLAFQSVNGQNEVAEKTVQDFSVQQSDTRIENLKVQAKDFFEAYDKQIFDKFVALSHPKVYEKDGLKDFFDEFSYAISSRSETCELLPSTIEPPGEIIDIDNQLFCVVPYKLNGISRNTKKKVVSIGSMVGISDDEGKSWKFAKGAAFNKVFLNIAAMIAIPNPMEKRLENDIEQ
jgi:hypothetical protein